MDESINPLLSQTILIVDDTPHNLQLLFEYLSNAGYKVLVAHSGNKAIKTILSVHPDLILLDVMMPEVDGFETCRNLKTNASTQDIPIIFMTALAEIEHKLRGFNLGAVDYITKPIEQEELLARIQTHLSLRSLHQRLARDAAQQKLLFEISDRIRQSLDLKSILQTATQEIRSFLNCDLVWLLHLNDKNILIKAFSSASDINLKPQENMSWDYLCPNQEEYEFYLQGKILDIEDINNSSPIKKSFPLNLQARLIAPIIIKSTQTDDLPKINETSILWGWLIADHYNCSRQWQEDEINLLKGLTTQLAIAIKQGLLYQQLSQQALIDSLTQIYNRRYFNQRLSLEWRRLKRSSSPMSLIMCDVDCFKLYNDTYGHQQGDECLQRLAKAIATVIKRPDDILARYGGEEFAVILPHTSEHGAIKIAEDIRIAIKELNIPHLNSSVDSMVTISFGVANTVPNAEDNLNLLVEAADQALYRSKECGRDCITVYPSSISQSKNPQELELKLIKLIRQALQENLFSLYAQPIEPLEIDDPKRYFEILLRLTDEEDRVITPNVFLDIAERNFLMSDIDTWVIDKLLEILVANGDYSCWQNHRFAINLSGASLNSESFLEFLSQKLTDYQLPAHLFCFEITETVAISDLVKVAKFIKCLKNLGCGFALDDFGTGMSSLTYLKNLPVDYLKIDGSFIKELNYNKASKVMVEAINHIAEGIGLKTIAEFVENQTILDTVRDLNIDYAQGFHLGRPGILMDVIN